MTTEQAINKLQDSTEFRLERTIELLEELIQLLSKVHGNDTK